MSAAHVRAGDRLLLATVRRHRRLALPAVLSGIGWQLAAIGLPLVIGWTVQRGVVDGDRRSLWIGAAGILALGVVEAVLSALRHRYATSIYAHGTASLRERFLDVALAERDRYTPPLPPTGELIGRATGDVEHVGTLLDALGHTVAYLLAVPVIVGVLAVIDPALAGVVVLVSPLVIAAVWRYSARWEEHGALVQQEYAATTAAAEDVVEGFKVVAGLRAQDAMTERYRARSAALRDRSVTMARLWWRFEPLVEGLAVVPVVAVVWVGGERVIDGHIPLGALVAAIGLVLFLSEPVRVLGERIVTLQLARASARRVAEVLDAPRAPAEGVGEAASSSAGIEVELDAVGLAPGGEPLVRPIAARIAAGSRVELRGRVGSGKSTLLAAIAGDVPVAQGLVRLGGVPVDAWDRPHLRRTVLRCGPAPFLFSGTIAGNIAFARPDASEDDVIRAAEAADVTEFADALPHGLATEIGERGVDLSGGQRQRIGLARAILAAPAVLLLDGATTALDPSRELAVLRSLTGALPATTVVIVAPNPGIEALVDVVLDLDEFAPDGTAARSTAGGVR